MQYVDERICPVIKKTFRNVYALISYLYTINRLFVRPLAQPPDCLFIGALPPADSGSISILYILLMS